MRKRIIALLLALILTVGLLPTVALAAEGGETPTTGTGDVKNGYYEGTTWKEGPLNQGKLPTGVESVSKTAKPTSNPNEYEVTLEVVLKKTESQENPGSAATVLVLDHSGSMNGCAYCKSTTDDGVNYYHTEGCKYDKPHQWVRVTSEQSRMSAATKAVKDFIKTYSGRFDENGQETTIADLNLGRWVCLVWFNETGGLTGGSKWVDVSNKSGYQTATNTNGWKAHDGTNLDCGLRLADHWLKQSPVASINKSLKNVIVLSDGEPTYYLTDEAGWFGLEKKDITIGNKDYYVRGDGGSCDEDTYNTTKSTAATLRNSASVYTVCFGVADNYMDYGDITIGNYLKYKIATPAKAGTEEKFAYDASNANELNTAFAAITHTIVSGLNTGTVKDSLPTGITGSTATANGQAITSPMTWKLDDDDFDVSTNTETEGDKTVTTYTYTKTYYVTINPDDEKLVKTEDGYAPLNGKTTLTVKNSQGTDVEIPFPIPAGKVTPTKITDEITVTITGATNTETYDGTEKKAEGYTVTISDPRYTTNDFTFRGTKVVKATNASDDQYMMGLKADNFTNNNEKFTNVKFVVNDGWLLINKRPLTIKANDNTVDYNGKPHGENGYVATGLAEGDTVESVTFNGSQTNPGTYENLLVPSEAVIKNAKGDDVKDNYIITYTPGTLVINKLTNAITVTITGKQETKEYNGQTQTVTGFDYTVIGAEKNDVTVTLNQSGKDSASGKDVTTANEGKYMMGLTASDFNVSSTKYSNVTITTVNDGWLKITPIEVTLTSGSGSKEYDGTALTNSKVEATGAGAERFLQEVNDFKATGSVTGTADMTVAQSETNTISYTWKDGFSASNYTITTTPGMLTITPIAQLKITFKTETGGKIDGDTVDIEKTAKRNDPFPTFPKTTPNTGYYFDGWYKDNTKVTSFPEKVTENATYTAKWTQYTPLDLDLTGKIQKTLNSDVELSNQRFTINVKQTGAEVASATATATVSATTISDPGYTGSAPFQKDDFKLNFTAPGIYNYSIVEAEDGQLAGMTYDVGFANGHTMIVNVDENTTTNELYVKSVTIDGKTVYAHGETEATPTWLTITNNYVEPKNAQVTNKEVVVTQPEGALKTAVNAFKIASESEVTVLYPTGNGTTSNTLEVSYGTTAATLLYKITVYAGTESSYTFEDKDASFVYAENAKTVTKNGDYFTVTFEDGAEYAYVYVAVTHAISYDADGEYKARNFIGSQGAETTVTEKDPDKLTINFADYVQKELTATGTKTASDVDFTVDVKGKEWITIITSAEGEEAISTYADEFDQKYSRTLTAHFDSITGGETKTAPFNGSTVEIDHAGHYYFDLSEEKGTRTGVTYDETTYTLYVTVEEQEGSLVITNVHFYDSNDGEYDASQKITFKNTIDTGKDDYYPIIIPTIINKDTGMLNKTDHFAYVIGYPDGTVHPNGQITRAEVATIFFRLLRDEVRDGAFTTSNTYSDVAYGKWYNNPISTMSALGIITGYPDGTFKPNKPITRAEFAAIAARFDETQSGKSATFSDVIGHWAAKEIGIAYYNDWIKGYPDGTFKPDQNITRAEAMTMINRVLERKPESPADLLTNMNKWTDNLDTSKWYYLDVQEATNSHGYTRKTFNYELWRQMLPDPDWSRYER